MIMASSYTNNIVVAFLLLICGIFYIDSTLTAAATVRTLIAPISYDAATSLYTLTLATPSPRGGGPLLLELDNSNLWVDCVNPNPYSSPSFKPVLCNNTKACTAAESCTVFICASAGCLDDNCYPGNIFAYPACSNRTCSSWASVTEVGTLATSVWMDRVSLLATDGARLVRPSVTMPEFSFLCGDNTLLVSDRIKLPAGVVGGTGLSRAPIALPSQISAKIPTVARKFAYCLPSVPEPERGVIFFGDGPYVFFGGANKLDLSKLLTYTPLKTYSREKDAYFLTVQSISVDGLALPIDPAYFSATKKRNKTTSFVGGTRFSSGNPYTLLTPPVYDILASRFEKACVSRGIKPAPAIAPFEHCFSSASARASKLGFDVPTIDIVLKKKAKWRIVGANSVIKVNKDVFCLAFRKTDQYEGRSIVIGTFQQQNAFFQFDLAQARMGFISTLLPLNTTCSSFNFAY